MKRQTSKSTFRPMLFTLVFAATAAALLSAACGRAAAAESPSKAKDASRHFVGTYKDTLVTINGTSSLHNWTVKGGVIDGEVNIAVDPKGKLELGGIQVSIPVVSLKSSEGSGMDKTMYDAMDKKHHPTVNYSLTKATANGPTSATAGPLHFDTVGQLTISGQKRDVKLDVVVLVNGSHVTVTTETVLKMTDYGIKPPVAMFGMVKSGDAVTVKAVWQLDERK